MKIIKRIISMILVISLLISMTGCSLIQVDTEALSKGLHGVISSLTLTVILFPIMYVISLFGEGDEEPAILDSMRNWWDDIVYYDKKKETVPETEDYSGIGSVEVDQEKYYADESVEEEKEKSWLAQLWDKIRCNDELDHYDRERAVVTCMCGDAEERELIFEEFQKYVDGEEFETIQEYRRYYGINLGISPETMYFLLNFETPPMAMEHELDIERSVTFMENATDKISTYAENAASIAEALDDKELQEYVDPSVLEPISEYFGAANTVLSCVSIGIDMAKVDEAYRNGTNKEEIVNKSIDILKRATSFLPVAGDVFGDVLDCVNLGINVNLENYSIKMMEKTLYDAALYIELNPEYAKAAGVQIVDPSAYKANADALVHAFNRGSNVVRFDNQDTWDNGPSLNKLATLNLTPAQVYGLAPYIEYRLNYETQQYYGSTVQEIAGQAKANN